MREGRARIKRLTLETLKDRFSALNELDAVTKLKDKDVFLALEETLRMDDPDKYNNRMGAVIMTENWALNLEEFLQKGSLSAMTALDLSLDIAEALRTLRSRNIGHVPPIVKEVLLVGDVGNETWGYRAVLCSSLTNTNVRIRQWQGNLARFLTFRGWRDSRARVITKKEAEVKDNEALSLVIKNISLAMSAEEKEKLNDVATDEEFQRRLAFDQGDYVQRIAALREAYLERHPEEGTLDRRSQRRKSRLLGGFWKPKEKGVSALQNSELEEAVPNDAPEIEAVKAAFASSEILEAEEDELDGEEPSLHQKVDFAKLYDKAALSVLSKTEMSDWDEEVVEPKEPGSYALWPGFNDYLADVLGDTIADAFGIRRR